jgi:hydrogenase/urease nickel incorporation metallochaperone HypA
VVAALSARIAQTATRPWVLMEVCGGQTHSIVRYGIDRMLPPTIELVHGPGCPVCVTSLEMIDKAHAIASLPDVIFTSFGDMLRVPGSGGDLLTLRSRGADVRVVYSPLDAVRIARQHPDKQVVFFGIGFETTAPANAMAIYHAKRQGVTNFSMLASHVLVPPAMAAILQAPGNRVQGFLGPRVLRASPRREQRACAVTAGASTVTRATVASMRSRSPARPADHACLCSIVGAVPCRAIRFARRLRCSLTERSSPSRASVGITWQPLRITRRQLRCCARASTARTDRLR